MTQTTSTQAEPARLPTPPPIVAAQSCPVCGRTAEVVDRFTLASTSGPVQHMRLRCADGRHHLTLIV